MKPEEATAAAVEFLRDAMRQVPLSWPAIPRPIATRCSGGADGVGFQYLVHTEHTVDAARLARIFEDHWRAGGMAVEPSSEDFGKYGTVYSATADAPTGPSAAIEVSKVGINLYVDSSCAEGDVADYE